MNDIITEVFQDLGILKTYYGYSQAICAIELVLEDEERLCHITKEVYWRVANICNCKYADIERNIRTIIMLAWQKNPGLLSKIARYELTAPPTVSEFIAIIYAYAQRQSVS